MTEREMLIDYQQKRRSFEELEKQTANAKLDFEKAESVLVEALLAKEAQSTSKYSDIGQATLLKPKLYAQFKKEHEEEVFSLIRAEGEESLIKPTVHPSSFSGFVGRLMESGKAIPEYVSYYMKQGVRFLPSK